MWHTKRWQQNHYSSFRHRNVTPRWRKKGGNRVETQLDWTMRNFNSAKDKSLLLWMVYEQIHKHIQTALQLWGCDFSLHIFQRFWHPAACASEPTTGNTPWPEILGIRQSEHKQKRPIVSFARRQILFFLPLCSLNSFKNDLFLSSDLFTLEIDL